MIAPRGDNGTASIILITLGLIVVILGVVVAGAGSMLLAHQRAGSAADLAALAAATQVLGGEATACRAAERIARANGAALQNCRLDGVDAVVTVRVTASVGVPGGRDTVMQTARAGPLSSGAS